MDSTNKVSSAVLYLSRPNVPHHIFFEWDQVKLHNLLYNDFLYSNRSIAIDVAIQTDWCLARCYQVTQTPTRNGDVSNAIHVESDQDERKTRVDWSNNSIYVGDPSGVRTHSHSLMD